MISDRDQACMGIGLSYLVEVPGFDYYEMLLVTTVLEEIWRLFVISLTIIIQPPAAAILNDADVWIGLVG